MSTEFLLPAVFLSKIFSLRLFIIMLFEAYLRFTNLGTGALISVAGGDNLRGYCGNVFAAQSSFWCLRRYPI